MLKAELHAHVAGDPMDSWIEYSSRDLLDRLCSLGYDVVAITPHTRLFEDEDAIMYAKSLGIVLIPGIEARIGYRDVLLYNCDESAERISTWDELETYRSEHPETLVIAPHPFFPEGAGSMIELRPHLFDAWEWSTYYSRTIDLNRRLERLSVDKPIVGTGDVHDLADVGSTFTWIDAERAPRAVIEAIRAGTVRLETCPRRTWDLIRIFAPTIPAYLAHRARRLFGREVGRPV